MTTRRLRWAVGLAVLAAGACLGRHVAARTGGTPFLKIPYGNTDQENAAYDRIDQCLGSLLGANPSCTASGVKTTYAATDASGVTVQNTTSETVLHSRNLGQQPAVGGFLHLHAGGLAGITTGKNVKWGVQIGGTTATQVTLTSVDGGFKYDADVTCVVALGTETYCTGTFVYDTTTTPTVVPLRFNLLGAWPTAVLATSAQPSFNNNDGNDFILETVFTVEVSPS